MRTPPPRPGQLVALRRRRWLVHETRPGREHGDATAVGLHCVDEDAAGEPLVVLWELELGPKVLGVQPALDMRVSRLEHDRPADHRPGALLEGSCARQPEVTVALARQLEEALAILLAGIDVANHRTRGALLRELGADSAPAVHEGLVGVLLRLVFLLYCEDRKDPSSDRALLPMDQPLYLDSYSLTSLVVKLEEDRVLHPEAMRDHYGAWPRLCALFRLVHGGIRHGELVLPARQGELFDPNRHPWLEGRPSAQAEPDDLPPMDDGVVADVLERLVYLEGQRLSYSSLDVEQIGSVHEALMALEVRRCATRTVPVRGGGWLELGRALDDEQPLRVIGEVAGLSERQLLERCPALARFVATGDRRADEDTLTRSMARLLDASRPERGPGQHILVGGAERRKTGSPHTPLSLTRPIVERTLAPLLGEAPSAAKILDLRVCDPAMGSGAFLAEACRYLSRRLLDAWRQEGKVPPADQGDPLLLARRVVAERCLYGVDKNKFAVQLARLSLWLLTLSKDKPFTFVNHTLREGDAVMGLSVGQIAAFSFEDQPAQGDWMHDAVRKAIGDAARDRARITEDTDHQHKDQHLRRADEEVDLASRRGDLLLAVSWSTPKGQAGKERFVRVRTSADAWLRSDGDVPLSAEAKLLLEGSPLAETPQQGGPFHWELRFPEVFARPNPGFDAIVGNPPFGGKNTILANGGEGMITLHQKLRPHAHGNADLCAWFFLRAASVLRKGGTFGLVATNTITQGDTRATGLQHLLVEGGVTLYEASTVLWPVPGAAVVVERVHGIRGTWEGERWLNGAPVTMINSGLTAGPELEDPVVLAENRGRCFIGSHLLGTGFVLDPSEARSLMDADPRNAEIIRPYLGGEELNNNPPGMDGMVMFSRYVIDFGDRTLTQAEAWPALMSIVRERVKPSRDRDKRPARRDRWWQFAQRAPALYTAIRQRPRCLVTARVSRHHLFAFQAAGSVFSEQLIVVALDDPESLAVLQSRVHEAWARGLGSTRNTNARYTPSTVFETFPFPRPTEPRRVAAAVAGEALDQQRTLCMRRFGEGMTKIWNRLLHPDEADPEIVLLRDLRERMDHAVLAAYGWEDLSPDDTAGIITRLRSLNAQRAAEEQRKA